MSQLINKQEVKRQTLAKLAEKRPHLVEKMTRISGEYYEEINRAIAAHIEAKIDNLNTAGKTIK